MASFKDINGKSWHVDITAAAFRRVKVHLGVDLMGVIDPEANVLQRLASDPALLVDVVYLICKPQADEAGVKDEQFGEAMGGDAIAGATAALREALIDFFPPGQRPVLKSLLAKIDDIQSKATAIAMAKLNDPETDAEIERRLKQLGSSSGNAQASPG